MKRYRIIKTIIKKDFLQSLKNKTVLIAILLPVVASLFFSVIDSNDMQRSFKIGIVENENNLSSFVDNSVENLQAVRYQEYKTAREKLEFGEIEALVVVEDGYTVYLDSSQALTYFFLKDSLEDVIEMYLNKDPVVEINYVSVNTAYSRLSFLPVWITITITMIGVLIISGAFAEEKEKKTLNSIIITPARKSDILLAKAIFGVLFTFVTIFIMCLLNGVYIIGLINIYILIFSIIMASICFTTIGLLIGSFTDSQSTARSIGTIIYFPLLFPTLIAELSDFTRFFARFFPTHYIYRILEKIFVYQGRVDITGDIGFLILFTFILSTITYFRFRKVS
ncbi:MAG: ABC transporter permease [Halanaerobiaceae bacterium]